MIDFIDHIPGEGSVGKRKLIHADGTSEVVTVEMADNAVVSGTPLNREYLMGIQGYITSNVKFNPDGSIIETNSKGQTTTTTFNPDGSITEVFKGDKTITKKTTINPDGSIDEVIL